MKCFAYHPVAKLSKLFFTGILMSSHHLTYVYLSMYTFPQFPWKFHNSRLEIAPSWMLSFVRQRLAGGLLVACW